MRNQLLAIFTISIVSTMCGCTSNQSFADEPYFQWPKKPTVSVQEGDGDVFKSCKTYTSSMIESDKKMVIMVFCMELIKKEDDSDKLLKSYLGGVLDEKKSKSEITIAETTKELKLFLRGKINTQEKSFFWQTACFLMWRSLQTILELFDLRKSMNFSNHSKSRNKHYP